MYFAQAWPLERLIASATAKQKGIDNTPPAECMENLERLSRTLAKIEEALAAKYPKAKIWIESGYRCEALNKAVGGSAGSSHMEGSAADVKVSGITLNQLAALMKEVVPDFDQIILEFGRWVHIGIKSNTKGKRQELLTATKNTRGKTVYVAGIEGVA